MLRFYLHSMLFKYKERQWLKSGDEISHLYFERVTLERCVKVLKRFAKTSKAQ